MAHRFAPSIAFVVMLAAVALPVLAFAAPPQQATPCTVYLDGPTGIFASDDDRIFTLQPAPTTYTFQFYNDEVSAAAIVPGTLDDYSLRLTGWSVDTLSTIDIWVQVGPNHVHDWEYVGRFQSSDYYPPDLWNETITLPGNADVRRVRLRVITPDSFALDSLYAQRSAGCTTPTPPPPTEVNFCGGTISAAHGSYTLIAPDTVQLNANELSLDGGVYWGVFDFYPPSTSLRLVEHTLTSATGYVPLQYNIAASDNILVGEVGLVNEPGVWRSNVEKIVLTSNLAQGGTTYATYTCAAPPTATPSPIATTTITPTATPYPYRDFCGSEIVTTETGSGPSSYEILAYDEIRFNADVLVDARHGDVYWGFAVFSPTLELTMLFENLTYVSSSYPWPYSRNSSTHLTSAQLDNEIGITRTINSISLRSNVAQNGTTYVTYRCTLPDALDDPGGTPTPPTPTPTPDGGGNPTATPVPTSTPPPDGDNNDWLDPLLDGLSDLIDAAIGELYTLLQPLLQPLIDIGYYGLWLISYLTNLANKLATPLWWAWDFVSTLVDGLFTFDSVPQVDPLTLGSYQIGFDFIQNIADQTPLAVLIFIINAILWFVFIRWAIAQFSNMT